MCLILTWLDNATFIFNTSMVTIQKKTKACQEDTQYVILLKLSENKKTAKLIQIRDPGITASQQALKDRTSSHFCKQKSAFFLSCAPYPQYF